MLTGILIAAASVAVLGLMVVLQVRRRRVTPRSLIVLPVVFTVLSLAADASWPHELHSGLAIALLAGGSAAAILFGVLRAATIKFEMGPKGLTQKGNWLTGVLWLGTFAIRIVTMVLGAGHDVAQGAGWAFVFVALTFAAQNVVVARRAGLLGGGRRPVLAG